MAEIKSTLDIVLEKTKHLTLSAEEKAEMQLQDGLKKVPGYLERILDLTLTPEQLLNEINALPLEHRKRIREEIAGQMSQALDLSAKSDPLIGGLEILAEPGWSDLLDKVKRCREDLRQAREDARQQAHERVLANLAAVGIKGSAVVARLEDDALWQEEDRRLREPCEKRLKALREAITSRQAVGN